MQKFCLNLKSPLPIVTIRFIKLYQTKQVKSLTVTTIFPLK